MNYFIDRIPRAMKAKKHTEEMAARYNISNGIVYGCFGTDANIPIIDNTISNRFITTTMFKGTVDKAILYAINDLPEHLYNSSIERNIWVLNFASYKHPGGMFMKGSSAQEESLCHISNLYNHLVEEKQYYSINNSNLNRSLYTDRCIVHKNVAFEIPMDNNSLMVRNINVITCAAPNLTAALKYGTASREECNIVMQNRIKFLYNVLAAQHNIDVLILGAFGCGVFGNDAELVANCFKETFKYFPNYNNSQYNALIIHPIPDDKNYNKFVNVYGNI